MAVVGIIISSIETENMVKVNRLSSYTEQEQA